MFLTASERLKVKQQVRMSVIAIAHPCKKMDNRRTNHRVILLWWHVNPNYMSFVGICQCLWRSHTQTMKGKSWTITNQENLQYQWFSNTLIWWHWNSSRFQWLVMLQLMPVMLMRWIHDWLWRLSYKVHIVRVHMSPATSNNDLSFYCPSFLHGWAIAMTLILTCCFTFSKNLLDFIIIELINHYKVHFISDLGLNIPMIGLKQRFEVLYNPKVHSRHFLMVILPFQ